MIFDKLNVEDVWQDSVTAMNILIPLSEVNGEICIICLSEGSAIAAARIAIDNPITKTKEIPSRHDEIYPVW